jgi:hypothetical protein
MDMNNVTNVDDSQNEIYSSFSQIPLTTNKKPSTTYYFSWSTLSLLERYLLILNIGLVVILLPLVITSVHKIGKIHGMFA